MLISRLRFPCKSTDHYQFYLGTACFLQLRHPDSHDLSRKLLVATIYLMKSKLGDPFPMSVKDH
jgi:hypothetical protein